MGNLTDYGRDALINHIYNTAYTAPSAVFLALATADPTDAATGASMNEVADANGYARKAITFAAPSSGRVTQSAPVVFDQATGPWGTVSHWAIVDDADHGEGNVLAHGALSAPKSIVSGNTPSVASGEVYVEITGEIGTSTANSLLNLMFRNQAYSKPDTYLALVTSPSSAAGIGTEVSGNGYARVQVNPSGGSAPAWADAVDGSVENDDDIDFAEAEEGWGTVVGVAVMSALSGGTLLMYDNDMTDQVVGEGDTVTFLAGDFVATLS